MTKGVDLTTTVIGLRLSPVVSERNPLAAAMIAQYGVVPGLVVGSVLTVAAMIVLIEGGFRIGSPSVQELGGSAATTGRGLCYAVGCSCNLVIASYNAAVVVRVAFS
ncbi:hypothetical protein [Halobaculum halobium]|uniref:Uncharacterized protein n=1 Tax=Halobaculum halobium TaxID=3032281 RepID=A0ABD5T682_9EURY|nr:hypothetical protein [Halobaculum sp. SYNS20]